jgi:hypothetical protein
LPLPPETFVQDVPEFVVRITRGAAVPYVSKAASAHAASVGLQTMERTFAPGVPEDLSAQFVPALVVSWIFPPSSPAQYTWELAGESQIDSIKYVLLL